MFDGSYQLLVFEMVHNIKKTKSMVISQSRTISPRYGDLTLSGTELEEVKSLRILGVALDSKLTLCRKCAGSCVESGQESGCRAPRRKVV